MTTGVDRLGQPVTVGDYVISSIGGRGNDMEVYVISDVVVNDFGSAYDCNRIDLKHKKNNVRLADEIVKIDPETVTCAILKGSLTNASA